jgi:hypothetical protein
LNVDTRANDGASRQRDVVGDGDLATPARRNVRAAAQRPNAKNAAAVR